VKIVKTVVTAVKALRQKERQGETQKIILMNDFLSFTIPPPLMLMYFFARFFQSYPVYDQAQGTVAVLS
jgi:hypothetical protein